MLTYSFLNLQDINSTKYLRVAPIGTLSDNLSFRSRKQLQIGPTECVENFITGSKPMNDQVNLQSYLKRKIDFHKDWYFNMPSINWEKLGKISQKQPTRVDILFKYYFCNSHERFL